MDGSKLQDEMVKMTVIRMQEWIAFKIIDLLFKRETKIRAKIANFRPNWKKKSVTIYATESSWCRQ